MKVVSCGTQIIFRNLNSHKSLKESTTNYCVTYLSCELAIGHKIILFYLNTNIGTMGHQIYMRNKITFVVSDVVNCLFRNRVTRVPALIKSNPRCE